MTVKNNNLRDYVGLVLERRVKDDVQVSNGTTVPFGSLIHIKDLESRIDSLLSWRKASKKGSDKRANYSRLIGQLKNELRSAKKYMEKYGSPSIS